MIVSRLKIYVIALATVLCPTSAHPRSLQFEDGNINQLTFIGSVEGKSYFIEENILASWQEAKNFCNSSGMHLATVTTLAQTTFLNNAYDNVTFSGTHWTGGRDSLEPSQFSWDNNAEKLSSAAIDSYRPEDGMLTCVCFNPLYKRFYGKTCEKKYKIICELVHK